MPSTISNAVPRGDPDTQLPSPGAAQCMFPPGRQAAGAARTFTRGVLADQVPADCLDDVLQVVSELIANAAAASPGPCDLVLLRLTLASCGVLVEAGDRNRQGPPAELDDNPGGENGRGLLIVTALAASSGWYMDGPWKIVWATITVAAAQPAAVSLRTAA